MADVRIRVIADANDAIKNIQAVTDGGMKADKSLNSLSKTLSQLEMRQRKGEDVSEAYNKQLKQIQDQTTRTGNAALAAGKGFEEYAKIIERTRYALFKAGATGAAATFDAPLREMTKIAGSLKSEQMAEGARKQREYANAIEQARIEQEKFNAAVERGMVIAKDDKVEKLQYAYRELEKQLRENISSQVQLEKEGQRYSKYMVKLKDEASALSGQMKLLKEEMKKTARTPLNERMMNLVKSFVSAQLVVYGLRKAVTALVHTIKESSKAAAEAEETYNLYITTFEQVADRADKVALKLSSTLGIATSTAQKALGSFGDLMKGYGATDAEALKFAEQAANLTLDIISFKNVVGSTEEVMQSFASGLAGNVENFRKLGYVITQAEVKALLAKKGLDGLTGSALQQAMVQARLEIITKKAANAVGDMAKTIDSTINVQRRANEAWLEFKEYAGEYVNKWTTPILSRWVEILETINKANEAQSRFAKGESTSGIYDLNNAGDMVRFQNTIATGAAPPWTKSATVEGLTNSIMNAMGLFGASYQQVESALNNMGWMRYLEKDFPAVIDALKLEGARQERIAYAQQQYEVNYSSLSSMAQGLQGLIDSLNGVNGVDLSHTLVPYMSNIGDYARNSVTAGTAASSMKAVVASALLEAVSDIQGADWTEFVSPIDLALGKATERTGLEEKIKEIEKLYELVNNYVLRDGEKTEDEVALLQSIVAARTSAVDALVAIDKAEEDKRQAEKEAQEVADKAARDLLDAQMKEASEIVKQASAIQSLIGNLSGFAGGKTDVSAEWYMNKDNALSLVQNGGSKLVGQTMKTLADVAFKQVFQEMSAHVKDGDWASFVSPIEQALEGLTEKGSLKAAVDELGEFYALSFQWAMQDGEIKDDEAEQLQVILDMRKKALDLQNEIIKADEREQAEAERKLALKELGEGSIGEIDMIIKAFTEPVVSAGGLVGTLIKLAAQLDIVQKAGSILSDTILPVLNQFLSPLMPVLDEIVDVVIEFLSLALQPFYELMKSIGPLLSTVVDLLRPLIELTLFFMPIIEAVTEAIAFVIGIINGSIKFIVDSIKWVVGQVMLGMTYLVNGVIDLLNIIPFVNLKRKDTSRYENWTDQNPVDSFMKGFDEVVNSVNQGNGLLEDVKNNTDPGHGEKLQYLSELFRGGLLSSEEYYAQRGYLTGERWDNTQLWSGGSYYNGAGSTVVRYGDVTINVSGTDLDADQVADAIEKKLRAGARGFQTA